MEKPLEIHEKAKYSLCKIFIKEISLTRMLGSLCLENMLNS